MSTLNHKSIKLVCLKRKEDGGSKEHKQNKEKEHARDSIPITKRFQKW